VQTLVDGSKRYKYSKLNFERDING
jgi:hypothetical protein